MHGSWCTAVDTQQLIQERTATAFIITVRVVPIHRKNKKINSELITHSIIINGTQKSDQLGYWLIAGAPLHYTQQPAGAEVRRGRTTFECNISNGSETGLSIEQNAVYLCCLEHMQGQCLWVIWRSHLPSGLHLQPCGLCNTKHTFQESYKGRSLGQ
jgi:hypothetical protein